MFTASRGRAERRLDFAFVACFRCFAGEPRRGPPLKSHTKKRAKSATGSASEGLFSLAATTRELVRYPGPRFRTSAQFCRLVVWPMADGRKPFGMCSCEKLSRKSPGINSCKFIGLKTSWNEQLRKSRGWGALKFSRGVIRPSNSQRPGQKRFCQRAPSYRGL